MYTAVVLAGGDPVDPGIAAHLPRSAFVVAADSGLHLAAGLGLRVDVVVGDFDSVDPALLEVAIAAGARAERHPEAKDETDLELAIRAAVAHGASRAVVVGGAGGRVDHFLANLFLLAAPAFRTVEIEAHMAGARLFVTHGGRDPVELHGRKGSLVTLLPVCGPVFGVTSSGLRYPLAHAELQAGTTRGVSNTMVGATATVELAHGTLVVVQPDSGRGSLA